MKKRTMLVWGYVFAILLIAAFTCTAKSQEEESSVDTLLWYTVGNGMPDNYEAWQAHINEYLEEKIDAHVDVQVIPWGDWDNKKNLIVNAGEYFDLLFTNSGTYNMEASMGIYKDITDLVKTETPDLYNFIPEAYWGAVSVGGKIYSVPTYKDSSATLYMVWDTEMADKYGINIQATTDYESLTEAFMTIRNGENTAPFKLYSNGTEYPFHPYDFMGIGLPVLGVRYDDESRTVVNTLKQDDVLEFLNLLHLWYTEGIINADAPTLHEQNSYRTAFIAQGWPYAAKSTWGPNTGIEAEAVQFSDTIVSNSTVGGSLNGIYSGSKYPEKCIKLLELMNTDSYVRDAFYYGLEGENFEYTEDGRIHKLNSEWTMAGYTQGTFFNVSQLDSDDYNQWNEVKELNANAVPSVLIGFNLDPTNIETELAECRAIYLKYRSELLTGIRDPYELTDIMTEELNAAGFQKVIAEAQKQVDAFK